MDRKKVCIVGMGPAGLMAGTILLEQGCEVHFFDHKKAAGRKFLVAGNGGFNLTHCEIPEAFASKYNRPYLQAAFQQFELVCMHIYHSAGVVETGEICLFVFVSSKHRKMAQKAIEFIVEEIKEKAPVFGKELFADSSHNWKVNI